MVPGMYEPPSRYTVIVTVARDDSGRLPDPVTFAVAASAGIGRDGWLAHSATLRRHRPADPVAGWADEHRIWITDHLTLQ